jgi:hypothetical protein
MKENEINIKENQSSDAISKIKKDPIKERILELKATYDQMVKLRKDNLDTFKKIDMSK